MSTKIGLANIGNTCFLNVVLQALRISPPIGEIFLQSTELKLRDDSKKKEMVTALQTLMRDFWRITPPPNAKPVMMPRGFFESLLNVLRTTEDTWYSFGQQADAAEALQYILDSVHDGMYRRVHMSIRGDSRVGKELSQAKAIESWARFFGKEYSPIVQNFNGQTQICVTCSKCKSVSERYEPCGRRTCTYHGDLPRGRVCS